MKKIARAILFGSQIEEPFYVLNHDGFPTEGLPNKQPLLFREYHRKLCCLSDRLYTDAGKEIALKQQDSMNYYFEGLIKEVKNNYSVRNDLLKKHIEHNFSIESQSQGNGDAGIFQGSQRRGMKHLTQLCVWKIH